MIIQGTNLAKPQLMLSSSTFIKGKPILKNHIRKSFTRMKITQKQASEEKRNEDTASEETSTKGVGRIDPSTSTYEAVALSRRSSQTGAKNEGDAKPPSRNTIQQHQSITKPKLRHYPSLYSERENPYSPCELPPAAHQ